MKRSVTCFLIDDDPDDQEIFSIAIQDVISDMEITCKYADHGIDALEKLEDPGFTPDFIFLDLNMPRMNGRQCLVEIKKIKRLEKVPVFMYSTSSEDRFKTETDLLGATGYIVKPASISELTGILHQLLHAPEINQPQ